MKNVRITILALAVALVLIGAAYAVWSETLQITGTAATGEIDVQFANPSPSIPGTVVGISLDGKDMTVSLSDVHPGYTVTITYDVINYGSLPAELDEIIQANTLGLTVSNSLIQGDTVSAGATLPGQELVISVNADAEYEPEFVFHIVLDWVVYTP